MICIGKTKCTSEKGLLTITEGFTTTINENKVERCRLLARSKHGLNQPCIYIHIWQLHFRSHDMISCSITVENSSLSIVYEANYVTLSSQIFVLVSLS